MLPLLSILLFFFRITHQLELHCQFELQMQTAFDDYEWDIASEEMDLDDYHFQPIRRISTVKEYRCNAKNLTTSYDNRNISKIFGDHLTGKSNSDVTELSIHLQNTPFLPINIAAHFPNLKTYKILKSNVQHLMTGDLEGLEKLTTFGAPNNPIKQLGHEFFNGVSEITIVDFHDCHLKRIDAEAFNKLPKLKSIDLDHNDCIDVSSGFDLGLSRIKSLVKAACQGQHAPIDKYSLEACNELNLVEFKESSSFADVFLIFLIVIFSLIAIFLIYVVIKIHKVIRRESWNEMTTNTL